MTTPIEKPNHAKFCEFHEEIKQNSGKEQSKAAKKGETSGKDKALAIQMVQAWERVARQKITQSFSSNTKIFFPTLGRLRLEVKNQLVPVTTPLIGFSGEIIWPIGQIQLPVTIGDEEHSASTLMNFVVVRSPSPYNGIIGRPGVRKLQAVLSIVHGMLKIPVEGGVITLKSSRLVPLECATVSEPERTLPANKLMVEERIKVAINLEYLEQTVMIGSTLTEEGRNKLAPLERTKGMFSCQTKEKRTSGRQKPGNTRGSRKTSRERNHEGSALP
ncbi:hypothetical protein Tco_1544043 [Tanacetum coccineum]